MYVYIHNKSNHSIETKWNDYQLVGTIILEAEIGPSNQIIPLNPNGIIVITYVIYYDCNLNQSISQEWDDYIYHLTYIVLFQLTEIIPLQRNCNIYTYVRN